MDRVLHPERIDREGRKVTFEEALGELPDGSMVLAEFGDEAPTPALLWDGMLHRWTPGGYDSTRPATRCHAGHGAHATVAGRGARSWL